MLAAPIWHVRLHLTGRVEAILAIRLAKKKLIIVDKTYPSFFAILTFFVRPRSSCFVAVPSSSPTTASFPSVLPQCQRPPAAAHCGGSAHHSGSSQGLSSLRASSPRWQNRLRPCQGPPKVEVKLDKTTNFFVPPSTYPLSHQVLRSLTGEDVQFYPVQHKTAVNGFKSRQRSYGKRCLNVGMRLARFSFKILFELKRKRNEIIYEQSSTIRTTPSEQKYLMIWNFQDRSVLNINYLCTLIY